MEYNERANTEHEIRALIKASIEKFRTAPRNSFVDSLVKEFVLRLKLHEVEKLLKDLHRHKDQFPTMAYFESEIKSFERARFKRHASNGTPVMISTQRYHKPLPNIKTLAETLFQIIKKGETKSPAFEQIKKRLGLSEEQVWEAYNEWAERRVHPLVEVKKESLFD